MLEMDRKIINPNINFLDQPSFHCEENGDLTSTSLLRVTKHKRSITERFDPILKIKSISKDRQLELAKSKRIAVGSRVTTERGVIYTVTERIGAGTYGKTFEVFDENGQQFAMKVLRNYSNEEKRDNQNEIEKIEYLRSSGPLDNNLLLFYDTFEYGKNLCILMEKLDCDLSEFIKQKEVLSFKQLATIAYQLFSQLKSLNDIGLVHTDLKPDNIMFVERNIEEIKIIDYGNVLTEDALCHCLASTLQTINYRSPEVLLGLPVDKSIDIWSIGVILVEMYIGRQLFTTTTEAELLREISALVGVPSNCREGVHYNKFMKHNLLTEKDVWLDNGSEVTMTSTGLNELFTSSSLESLSGADIHFHSLLKGVLNSESTLRISLQEAISHQLFDVNI